MNVTNQTILITGATSGIGLHLGIRLHKEGNKVIISARNKNRLQEIAEQNEGMAFFACDVSVAVQREALAEWAISEHPQLNIVVNNAGIMRLHNLTGPLEADRIDAEVHTNLIAPIHMSSLFVQHLQKQAQSAIVNVTSGLAFTPLATVPVYCATKAGLHSFCVSLRHQLKNTSVKVFEIIPPAVETNLGHEDDYNRSNDHLMSSAEFVNQVLDVLKNDQYSTLR